MKLNCDGRSSHLSYCTNIHAGDTWEEVFPQLKMQLPKVRSGLDYCKADQQVSATGSNDAATEIPAAGKPVGIGLRLSYSCLESLEDADTFAEFEDWLKSSGHYVFTINGFPYGPFHGVQVKENVYKPDWTENARLDYTCRLSRMLAQLNPPDNYGSISTLPGTYKDWAMPGSHEAIASNLIKAVAHNVKLERETGVRIALALEPEPCCLLETIAETVQFFNQYLYSDDAADTLAELTELSRQQAQHAMHEFIGVCYDVCHSAVEFEEPAEVIARLQTAGIPIIKLQLSSALRIPLINAASIRHLSRFDEPVYLHQVVENRDGKLTRYNDLRNAIKALQFRLDQRSQAAPELQLPMASGSDMSAGISLAQYAPKSDNDAEWRVHFHVPVFLDEMTDFSTTQPVLQQILRLQKQHGIARHLEVETYTWDVLPDTYRNVPVSTAIARELNWVTDQL